MPDTAMAEFFLDLVGQLLDLVDEASRFASHFFHEVLRRVRHGSRGLGQISGLSLGRMGPVSRFAFADCFKWPPDAVAVVTPPLSG